MNKLGNSKPVTPAANTTAINTRQKDGGSGIKTEILDEGSSDKSFTETQSKAPNGNGNGSSVSANNSNGRFQSQTQKRSPLRMKPKPSATQTSQSQSNRRVVNLSDGDEDTETDSFNASKETMPTLDKSLGEAERLNSSFVKTEKGLDTTVLGKSRESNQGETAPSENIAESTPRGTSLMTPLPILQSRLTGKRKASEPGTEEGLPLTKQIITEGNASCAETNTASETQFASGDINETQLEKNKRLVCVDEYLNWLFVRYQQYHADGIVSSNIVPLLQKVLQQKEARDRLFKKIFRIRKKSFLMENRTTEEIFLVISETIKQIIDIDMEDVVRVYTATINLLTAAKRV